MKIYVAPARGKSEKIYFEAWLQNYGFEFEILDQDKQVAGPLLLCGGADLGKDPKRDCREYGWIRQAIEGHWPIIGVCRGMQILNQYFGGEVRDLEDLVVEAHSAQAAEDGDHAGRPSQYHIVEDLEGNTMQVNSRHHQFCPVIADNFKVTHRHGEIVEGIADEQLQIWAVQWHPERMESDDNNYPLSKLFSK